MKLRQLFFVFATFATPVFSDSGDTNVSARAILEQVVTNRAQKDFSLKARLTVTRDQIVLVEMFVKNLPDETRTLYRHEKSELLVVQPVHGAPRFFLRGGGELKDAARMGKWLDSNISYYDLGMGFLHWPEVESKGEDKFRGRPCYILETRAVGEPYVRVKLWIDKQYRGLLRAEAVDENENVVRRFAITSFRRVGEAWIPRGIEIAYVPPGQTLASHEKSRIEVYDGSYDVELPAEWFDETKF